MKIMLVDDSKFVRMVLRKILEQAGYEVACEASDGNEAYAKLENCKPDILILDINMPNMNGLDLLKKLQESGTLSKLKVVMLTALDQPWSVDEARKLGAVAFISKPIKPDRVLEVIRSIAGA